MKDTYNIVTVEDLVKFVYENDFPDGLKTPIWLTDKVNAHSFGSF